MPDAHKLICTILVVRYRFLRITDKRMCEPMINADKENDWLISYMRNVTSQTGEDGIIEKIFEIIKENDKWCVEFGAWDGKKFSNTWTLIKNKGWFGVLLEGDSERYKQLLMTYKDNPKVTCINKFVEFEGLYCIDNILSKIPIPKYFDLLCIDVDGNDYHIWDSMALYQPKVVVIEFNPSIPNDIDFIQPKNMNINQGSSLLSIFNLGREKGYELVATTIVNAIFVDRQYFGLFGINDNSLSILHKGHEYHTRLYQLFDGTLVLEGCNRLIWHGIEIGQESIQVLPRFLRFYPCTTSKMKYRSRVLEVLVKFHKYIHKYIYK